MPLLKFLDSSLYACFFWYPPFYGCFFMRCLIVDEAFDRFLRQDMVVFLAILWLYSQLPPSTGDKEQPIPVKVATPETWGSSSSGNLMG